MTTSAVRGGTRGTVCRAAKLPSYGGRTSRYDFTLLQRFVFLMLRQFLRTDYRVF